MGKTGKRPCRICKRWFTPHPRAGDRQRVCEREECRLEQHRNACAKWRARNPTRDVEMRLARKLEAARVRPPPAPAGQPLPQQWWDAARDAVGAKTLVVVRECVKVLDRRARDAVAGTMGESSRLSARVLPEGARDAFELRGPAP